MVWYRPLTAQPDGKGGYNPSPFTLFMGTSKKTDFVKQEIEATYTGNKPILVVCTDESYMEMQNKTKFSTGNHPVEMLVPMLHLKYAGFTFEFATNTGGSCKLEMWAFPTKDQDVNALYEEVKDQMDKPMKLGDITSMDDYAAIFIPGGHGAMINLPKSAALGNLLHMAHDQGMPTVTLCHGPAALLSTAETEKGFAYSGYELMCFTDKTDETTPKLGYLPGPMPWKCQAALEEKGTTVKNKSETGAVNQDRELITGDSPGAANNLGKFAAPTLVKWANENRA